MNTPLYNELTDLEYVAVTDLDLEYPPETVLIYLKNSESSDVRVSVQFLDESIQTQFENQNPTLIIEDTGEATICLAVQDDSENSCEGATDDTGCIFIQGTWDIELNGQIVERNASTDDILEYLRRDNGALEEGPICCDSGYFRPVPLPADNIQNGDVVYIPIALTPNGPSITSPITVNADTSSWYDIGWNLSQQLNQQLQPYGLSSDWTNNFKEFGVTYYNVVNNRSDVKEFYILEEGNTYSPSDIPRGLPRIICNFPS